MKRMLKSWFLTWIHVLAKFSLKAPHQMCSESGNGEWSRHFCSCGYLNQGIPWREFIAKYASPQAVTAAGGISLASIGYNNIVWVVGSPGAVTVTATSSITAGTAAGQHLWIFGTDATKTVTLQDNAGLSGSNLQLNGTWVGGLYSAIELQWDGSTYWVEISRR